MLSFLRWPSHLNQQGVQDCSPALQAGIHSEIFRGKGFLNSSARWKNSRARESLALAARQIGQSKEWFALCHTAWMLGWNGLE